MTTTTGVQRIPGSSGSEGRFAQLTERIRAVRGQSRFAQPDVWMLVVGGTLLPLGVLLIILGWLGAAHTPLAFEQTPYLISGGLLGLGLIIAGGFVYFGYWQTIRIRESRQQSRELIEALARVETLLSAGAGAPAVGTASSSGARAGSPRSGAAFVATPSGSIFHRPDCPVVSGRSDLTGVDARRTKLEACRICEPLADAG